jgi:hypothetical protein
MLDVAAGPDEHDTTAAHSAPVASAAAAVNFTRTSETIRRPAGKLPSRPITSNSPRRSRYAATSYRWRRERACRGDRVDGITAASRRFTGGRNDRCKPFTWTKPACEILAKAIRNERH